MKFLVQFIYLVFIVYGVMALFISLRDVFTTKHKLLWIPVITILVAIAVLLFWTTSIPALILPITLFISIPIFATDKRRNWDWIDRVFRWVSVLALLCATFIFVNYYFLR